MSKKYLPAPGTGSSARSGKSELDVDLFTLSSNLSNGEITVFSLKKLSNRKTWNLCGLRSRISRISSFRISYFVNFLLWMSLMLLPLIGIRLSFGKKACFWVEFFWLLIPFQDLNFWYYLEDWILFVNLKIFGQDSRVIFYLGNCVYWPNCHLFVIQKLKIFAFVMTPTRPLTSNRAQLEQFSFHIIYCLQVLKQNIFNKNVLCDF